ncbi:uncharacterized protein KIAA1958 homolog isoform X1 [Pteropus vampyrus]|uniref:Sorting nexin-30 n=1 Tax=Pteropus vampyrus TaxID=132908 RepID=A0A6P6C0J6_PTEVA|nr:uncharacterized protein KIAA1958 homolog isoform X1 [Pteropus vampyrus]XP_023380921.1 uncharacterized protein KIAA1958 homolog isoform X1 [Pteropus vampyrus]XP_023380922.1 uncharacterized protein KIAA1958 homolog isoform X1 [Pteropus vampyrus]XP_023380923.1 uncharacterized protein KIAA1958 homolog isoform X1 [Pteropus vampyrus]XP_023380924.1 uncharacterized protein KIAA1958 homolog isoform X1 [Pteropus vampyrus]
MEDCLHTSSENLSKLVSWAHSHGTICSLIPNLKHLLSEGSHGNLTAMWGCSAGHAYHWPLTATCRAGSQERVCFQDNRSFNSDSPSIIGVPSETQTSPVERYPGRPVKAKLDCNRTRDSCDFSYCSEPSELDEAVEEYEDENTLFDMVCESSVTDEDSDFEPQTQRPQSIARKRPGIVPSSLHSGSQAQMIDECSSDVIIKKIKQEIPEDYYIVANAELTGGIDGPALSLTQMAKPKPQTHAGPSCVGSAKLIPHVTSAISTELDPHGVSASPSVMSRPVVQKTARASLASPNRGPPGAHGTNQQVAMQMPVSTSHPNKQISIPLSALQLPGQDEQVASEEFLPHLPSQVSSCEVALSPSVNTEPEVSSSQQQPPVAPSITTEAMAQCIPAYSTKLNKFPVFNINDDLNDLCTSAVSPNTTKATRYALNVWRYWCMTNGLKDHTDITKDLILPNGGTPAGTSSPASSSSLLNRLQLDDDIDGETRDLFVTVDDPKKHVCTMETYITYRITTKSTRVEFDLPEYSVRRRYQDFDWLRNKLEESQPTHLIPPLPEKFVVKGVVDRFSEEFVETRRKALDKFLKRITDHPVLSFNEHFNVFLTAKDLNAYKKQGMALLTRVGESVKHVTGGYKLRSRPLEFAAIGEYLDTFALKLGTIDRIAQRIIKEEIEYLVELREYGPVYSTWSALEGELAEPLEGVSACIGNCSTALEELTDDMTEDFLPVLREYILYSDSMKKCQEGKQKWGGPKKSFKRRDLK